MSGFFDALPELPDEDLSEPELPSGCHPPRGVLAALVPTRLVLARTESVAVLLSHIDAYPQGCRFHLLVAAQRPDGMDIDDWWDLHEVLAGGPLRVPNRSGQQPMPDAVLRLGVQLADGTRAIAGASDVPCSGSAPAAPVLQLQGGGGGGGIADASFSYQLWLWPLPPPDRLDLVLQWPAVGIALTRVGLDGSAIVSAGDHCEPLFPSGAA